MLVDGGKYLSSKLVLLQQVAELANRGLVRHWLTAEIDTANCRMAAESYSASSTPGSERLNHSCRK